MVNSFFPFQASVAFDVNDPQKVPKAEHLIVAIDNFFNVVVFNQTIEIYQ